MTSSAASDGKGQHPVTIRSVVRWTSGKTVCFACRRAGQTLGVAEAQAMNRWTDLVPFAATGASTALARWTRGTEAGELDRAPRSGAAILMMPVNALTSRGIRAVRQR